MPSVSTVGMWQRVLLANVKWTPYYYRNSLHWYWNSRL